MTEALPKKADPFKSILEALLDTSKVFPPVYLHRFSDLAGADLKSLKDIWEKIPEGRRAALIEDLEDLYDSDTLLSFEEIARVAIADSHPPVRAGAIRLLWDYQGKDLVAVYQLLLERDPDEIVRAQSASILGQYVYLGELGEIPAELHRVIEDTLLQTVESGEVKLVRRRALESLGYSGRDEVIPLIQNAFDSGDFAWIASALFAMGRSTDERWASNVIQMLDHHEAEVQLEAIRAAGMLELVSARKFLLQMVKTGIDDADLRSTVAWSLSQIGGEQVAGALDKLLAMAEDDEETEFIQTAIDNLDFKQGLDNFELMDFSPARHAKFQVSDTPNDSQEDDEEDDEIEFDIDPNDEDEEDDE
ncbi:MAG TPA: HEAT repeat domain-containing protein [Longilinea sp.]|nr:HEAT repeat domain-containing protein [Longilinea sp.]